MQTYKDYRPTSFDRNIDIDRSEWLVAPVNITRDTPDGSLEASNFYSIVKALGGEGDNVEIHRFGHWGPGWFEIIIVKPDTPEAATLEEIDNALADYPVLDEMDYSEREFNAAGEYWEQMDVRERAYWCDRFDISIFAARRDEMPCDDTGELVYHLAN